MLYGMTTSFRSAVRRTAFVGPKMQLDVVDDIKQHGRVEFLVESHIDLKKGKAFDAWLHHPYRWAGDTNSGPTGAPGTLGAGGTAGRQSFAGTHALPRTVVGITHRRVTTANVYNQY